MSFFTKLLSPMTSEKLENKGQFFYKAGKLGMFCGLAGLGLLILSILGTLIIGRPSWVVDLLTFGIRGEFAFMYLIMVISYLAIVYGAIGIGLYFYGINLFALGRIAHNTEKE